MSCVAISYVPVHQAASLFRSIASVQVVIHFRDLPHLLNRLWRWPWRSARAYGTWGGPRPLPDEGLPPSCPLCGRTPFGIDHSCPVCQCAHGFTFRAACMGVFSIATWVSVIRWAPTGPASGIPYGMLPGETQLSLRYPAPRHLYRFSTRFSTGNAHRCLTARGAPGSFRVSKFVPA